ncbi:MAG: fibronectin type III domain-containing protein [Candidatus Pacebacteria bacterium]|nr:fibronectin type III domain-containing protein [Candidatus Paceibacterota bacterium]
MKTYLFKNKEDITLFFMLSLFLLFPYTSYGAEIRINQQWLNANGPAPYFLNQADTTYTLDTDITVDETAIIIGNKNITLNLNGHTIIYGNASPITVTNGGFETGNTTGWDTSNAPNASVASNNQYLWGNYLLKFTNFNNAQSITSDPISIPKANREYAALITHKALWDTELKLEVIDAVTQEVLGTATTRSDRGPSTVAKFVPATTNNVYIKITLTPASGITDTAYIDYARLLHSRDYGVAASPDNYYFPVHLSSYYTTPCKDFKLLGGGSVIQGQARGFASDVVYASTDRQKSGITVDGVTLFAKGPDSYTIFAQWSSYISVTNCTAKSDIDDISARMGWLATIYCGSYGNTAGPFVFTGNTIIDSPQGGIYIASGNNVTISGNNITLDAVCTNPYGINIGGRVNGFTVYNNTITVAEGKSGRGIIIGTEGDPNQNGEVYGNTVSVREQPNREYGAGMEAVALRMRTYVDGGFRNINIHDNSFTAYSGEGYTISCDTIRVTATVNQTEDYNVLIKDNLFKAIVGTSNGSYSACAASIEDVWEGNLFRFIGNTFESNDISLVLGGADGTQVYSGYFESNTIKKSSEGASRTYKPYQFGYWTGKISGVRILSPTYSGGATETITWQGSGTKEVSFGHILGLRVEDNTGKALSGANVIIKDKNNNQVFSGTTNSSGNISDIQVINTIYKQLGTDYRVISTDNLYPHTLSISLSGYTPYTQSLNLTQASQLTINLSSSSSPITYTLNILSTNGSVTKNPNQSSYPSQTSVILTANPNTGYAFNNWSGDLTGTTNPVTITMNSNKTITANFSLLSQPDTTPPILSSGSPTGTLSSSTITANLSLTTNENATCKYSTIPNTPYSSMNTAFTTTGSTSHSKPLTGLLSGTSYVYYVRCQDASSNVNTTDYVISFQIASPDTAPPSQITNLSYSNITQNSLTLTWTAPGDDGNTGTASIYDIRYSSSPITSSNFNSAIELLNEPTPLTAGTNQSYLVTGLNPNTSYYFAMITKDENNNSSLLSNVISLTTQSSDTPTLSVSLTPSVSQGQPALSVSLTAQVSGTAQGNINYTFYCNRNDSLTTITAPINGKYDNISSNTRTYTCTYSSLGTYTPKVIVERGTLQAEARTSIVVQDTSSGTTNQDTSSGTSPSGTTNQDTTPTTGTSQPATGSPQTPSTTPTPITLEFTKKLTYGTTDEEVRKLQTMLTNEGLYSSVISGFFGDNTLNAVKSFQDKYNIVGAGIPGYGIVGPKTREKLNELALNTDFTPIQTQDTQRLQLIEQIKTQILEIQRQIAELLTQLIDMFQEELRGR